MLRNMVENISRASLKDWRKSNYWDERTDRQEWKFVEADKNSRPKLMEWNSFRDSGLIMVKASKNSNTYRANIEGKNLRCTTGRQLLV